MDKIHIVSWLLTRRCNLKCSYCRISKGYDQPSEYPPLSHFMRNEMTTDFILDGLSRLHNHNPNAFHIFYGGEPLLRDDLSTIINTANDLGINYTIITNNSVELSDRMENLFHETGGDIKGLTSSIDPVMTSEDPDRFKKTEEGLNRLLSYKDKIKDIVAEITIDSETVGGLMKLIHALSDSGISSDITFVDIAKSKYYDFSNVTDESKLVTKNMRISKILQNIIWSELDVHMKDSLLYEIFNILPSNLNCEIEKNVHNLTIDADGTVRLCLRIRGVHTPTFKLPHYISSGGFSNTELKENLTKDKQKYCQGCNWTCMLMSKLLSMDRSTKDDLIHTNKREGV